MPAGEGRKGLSVAAAAARRKAEQTKKLEAKMREMSEEELFRLQQKERML